MRLEGNLDRCEPGLVSGWARDADRPDAALALEVFIGAARVGGGVADLPREDLRAAGKGDCGFVFVPDRPLTPADRDRLNVRAPGCGLLLIDGFGGPQPDPYAEPEIPAGAKRFRRAILHIGTEKTGTTSLQRFLAVNRERLMAAGLFVPASVAPDPGLLNHSDLAAAALADWRLDDTLLAGRGVEGAGGLAAFREGVAARLDAEMAHAPRRCETLFISSEHCHSRLLLLHEVAAIRRLLAVHAERVEVWVYLRPQHDLAASQYGMHLLGGVADADMLPKLPYPEGYRRARITSAVYFDYALLLSRWAAMFGRECVHPRLFLPGQLRNGDVVDDVLHRLGIASDGLVSVRREAGNVSPRAQRFMIGFLRAMASRAPAEREWAAGWVAERLRISEPGAGMSPSRGAVAAFMAPFAAGNERVRTEWFPQRATLFDIDPARFPELVPAEELSGEAVTDILTGLLRAERRMSEG